MADDSEREDKPLRGDQRRDEWAAIRDRVVFESSNDGRTWSRRDDLWDLLDETPKIPD
jgi:hypothetical protein